MSWRICDLTTKSRNWPESVGFDPGSPRINMESPGNYPWSQGIEWEKNHYPVFFKTLIGVQKQRAEMGVAACFLITERAFGTPGVL